MEDTKLARLVASAKVMRALKDLYMDHHGDINFVLTFAKPSGMTQEEWETFADVVDATPGRYHVARNHHSLK